MFNTKHYQGHKVQPALFMTRHVKMQHVTDGDLGLNGTA